MKRILAMLAAILTVVSGAVTLTSASPAGAADGPSCGQRWGSLPENAGDLSIGHPLVDIRAGRHACFDRLVFDFVGAADGYQVRYVDEVRHDASGDVIPVRGGARLQLTLHAPAHDESYQPTYDPANPREAVDVRGFSTLRQVVFAGTFEGYTTVGLGVRARLPFRVFTLDGPGSGSRIVVDVAHAW